jgi:hypothetical protein
MVLLYQMPKTGSQTLEATLRSAPLPMPVLRTHFLSEENVRVLRDGLASAGTHPAWKRDAFEQLSLISKLSRALRIRKFLVACGVPIPRLLVITAVRDIFGAALSSVFENHTLLVPELDHLTIEKCQELVSEPRLCAQFQNWFDLELKANLGIDIYAIPFPTQSGCAVAQNNLARVLVYRFDFLPRITTILEQFLGLPIPSVVNVNLGQAKEYAAEYEQARRFVRVAREVEAREHNSKLMRHFYSSEERASLGRRWLQEDPVPAV